MFSYNLDLPCVAGCLARAQIGSVSKITSISMNNILSMNNTKRSRNSSVSGMATIAATCIVALLNQLQCKLPLNI